MRKYIGRVFNLFKAIVLILALFLSSFNSSVFAAGVNPVRDELSSIKVSTQADHEIRLRTPSGVGSPTDTITIDLSSFTFGAVGVGDIDISHGPVTGLETADAHAAVAAAGVWGIAVGAGSVVLTPPTDAAPGEVPANDYFVIKIGTNATGGTNQLTNPAVAGQYYVQIAGGFGDVGTIAIPIVDNDSVTVTATVSGATPFQITSINPSSVQAGSGAFAMTVNGTGFVTSTIIRIDGSDRVTTYVTGTQVIVNILASDISTAGTKQISAYNPYPTPGTVSNSVTLTIYSSGGGGGGGSTPTPLEITNVQSIDITQTTARITWDTNLPADSLVDYGLTTGYGDSVSNGSTVLSHGLDLSGLTPGTTYQFRVTSVDNLGQVAVSANYTFTTLPTSPLVISNVDSIGITDTTASIIWDTNRSASSLVQYGTTPSLGSWMTVPGDSVNHTVPLSGLTPGTIYYYRVISQDQFGESATSTIYTFTTTIDQTPPSNIDLTATPGNEENHLTWTQPPEPDFAGVHIVFRTDGYPTGPYDGTLVYDGLDTSYTHTGLTNGVTYYYAAYAYDVNGNFSSGALDSATPYGPIPQVPTSTPITTTTTPPEIPPTPSPEPEGCFIYCDELQYDVYIINPNKTERHMNTGWVRTRDMGNGLTLVYFEDRGVDVDYNDVIVRIDKHDCHSIKAELVSISSVWDHEVRMRIFHQGNVQDIQLWPSSHNAKDKYVDAWSYSGLLACEKLPPIPTPTSTPAFSEREITPQYYAANGTLLLQPDIEGQFGVLGNSSLLVRIPTANLGATAEAAVIIAKGFTYSLALNSEGTAFEGTLVTPPEGFFSVDARVIFTDGLQASSLDNFTVKESGLIVEAELGTEKNPIPDASVTLYVLQDGEWQIWNASPYNQQNPQQSSADGSFAFIVPNGEYYAVVSKDGYTSERSQVFTVDQNVFGDKVSLIRYPKPIDITAFPYLQYLPDQLRFAVVSLKQSLREPALVSATEGYLVPALIAVSVLNSAAAISLFNVLSYLRFLFTQPILLLGRLRKKKWGVVYNSLTKQPVERAIVRLVHSETNLPVQSQVTDKQGRYLFSKIKNNNYHIEVIKPHYNFPTQFLANLSDDDAYTDIYHGEMIALEQQGEENQEAIVGVNVPIDPLEDSETPNRIMLRSKLRRIQHAVAILGLVLSLAAFAVSPTAIIGAVVLVQLGFYLLFQRLALPVKAKSWGVVLDSQTKKPVAQAIVRIFDKKFNKLLESRITDRKGRYGFLASNNLYYISVEKPGYDKYTSPDIDLVKQKDPVVDFDLELKPAKKAS